ncbi:MAG: ribonuclease P protein component 4 [Nanobdellota archaeon]
MVFEKRFKKKIARRSHRAIDELFSLQKKFLFTRPSRSQRYSYLIRRISRKNRVKLPRDIKRSYCKHCKTVFIPGKNYRVRIRKKQVTYYCFSCKKFTRIPFDKKRS